MKKLILYFCLFLGLGLNAQSIQPVLMCDTITGQQILVETVGLVDDCCYEWDGTNWTKRDNCNNVSYCEDTDYEEREICAVIDSEECTLIERSYVDIDNTIYYTLEREEIAFSDFAIIDCDKCYQVAGCVDFRASVATVVTLSDGTLIGIPAPGKPQEVINAVTAQCGGTGYFALGLSQGGSSITCNNVNVGEFVFTGLSCALQSFTTQFGTFEFQQFGDCDFSQDASLVLCEEVCYTTSFAYETEYLDFEIALSDGSRIDVVDCIGTTAISPDFQESEMEDCISNALGGAAVDIVKVNDLSYDLSICNIPDGTPTPGTLVIGRINYRFQSNTRVSYAELVKEKNSDDILDATREIKSVVCKKACSGGLQIDVSIGYNQDGTVAWYKDEAGNDIVNPDFDAECPPLECNTESLNICANGDYGDISDGDDFLGVFKTCNDGTQELIAMASFDDLSTSIPIPDGFSFTFCTGADLEFTGCFVDTDGVRWNAFIVNGTDPAYQNIDSGAFGTPNGSLSPCEDTQDIVAAIGDKHCISVGGDEYQGFIIVNADGSFAFKTMNGTLYQEGEYSFISCCPDTDVRTTYYNGFTVTRPSDTPNFSWNNQLVNSPPPLVGDFRLCFTPSRIASNTNNSAQMIGVNSDPNTNASWNTIDCALYLRYFNGQHGIWHYENGSFQGFMGNINYEGQEICYVRSGGVLTFEINGTPLNYTNGTLADCNIGTGNVFLDDSHYYAPGATWGSGSITYSDFELVTLSSSDNSIKSVAECCCLANVGGGGSVTLNKTFTDVTNRWIGNTVDENGGFIGIDSGLENALTAVVSVGSGNDNGLGNRYTLTFPAHPNGAAYQVYITPIGDLAGEPTGGVPNGLIPHVLLQTATSVTYAFNSGDDGQGVDEFDRIRHHISISGPIKTVLEDVTTTP